jgi:hypothetical protein
MNLLTTIGRCGKCRLSILLVIAGLLLPAASVTGVLALIGSAASHAAEPSDERPCDERPCDERDAEAEAEPAIRCARQRLGRLQGGITAIGRSTRGLTSLAGAVGRHSISLGHAAHRLQSGDRAPLRL